MNDYPSTGHEELWISCLPSDKGPEGNVQLWVEAEKVMDGLSEMSERSVWNEGVYCALVDGYNRCREERRRAEELLKIHERWDTRPIGGGNEPDLLDKVAPTTVFGLNTVLSDAAERLEDLGPRAVGGEEAYHEIARKIAGAGGIVSKKA